MAVDDLLYVDHYPPPETKTRVHRRLRQCGGLTGTALVAAARLGVRCAYVGLLGQEELSAFVRRTLQEEGVEMRWSVVAADAAPAHSTIVVDQSRKTRTIFSSLGGRIGADPHRPDAGLIRAASVLLVDHHGMEGTIRAARIAREAGRSVVADFERHAGAGFDEALALADHVVLSRKFALELTGQDDPQAAVDALWRDDRQAVVVTLGAEGCWYRGPAGQVRHQAAFPVEVVDTTGCGDVFHGAYAAALVRGADLDTCIRFASAAAALKATAHGGQAGSPRLPEVERLLALCA